MTKLQKVITSEVFCSVVIPLYNEEEVIPELLDRVSKVFNDLPYTAEVLLINDGSSDQTRSLLDDYATKNDHVIAVHLSRNFGHQAAVSAGLYFTRGNVVVVMDGDLQDPPELIPKLIEKISNSYDVVYAIRKDRKENWIKRILYYGFYRILNCLSTVKIPLDSGDFSVMSRRVVDVINSMPEKHRFIRGLRAYSGFHQSGLEFSRSRRTKGKTKYSILKLLSLAADGIFTFSHLPLRFTTILGFGTALVAVLYGIYILIWRLLYENDLPGFATLAVAMFFLGGVQLIAIGMLGEYIGRIHTEVKNRPEFIVESIVGRTKTLTAKEGAHNYSGLVSFDK